MSFVTALALTVAALLAVPVAAHLLRRWRAEEREFPAASLVAPHPPVAHQRRRLEDRALLAVRALAVITLAVLGATPLVRCSRITLARSAGASLAVVLVVDDSLSMRARLPDGRSRFEAAREAASDLVRDGRPGDAFALVLAGSPARLALAPTTDLAAARAALGDLAPSDRATDLAGALGLARSALAELPHADRRVVLLSDLGDTPPPPGEPQPWVVLPDLATPAPNCGVAFAEQRGARIVAEVACTTADAARGRALVADAPAGAAPPAASLAERAGVQQLELAVREAAAVRLDGADSLAYDDRAEVAPEGTLPVIGVVADPSRAAVSTGGATVVERALQALERPVSVRPLPVVPEDDAELARLSALVLDDPPALAPAPRGALVRFVERGGVALALLGPGVGTAQLGSSFEPFLVGTARYEPTTAAGAVPDAWLGVDGATLSRLNPRGRVELRGAEPPGAVALARWTDGAPFALRRVLGRGAVLAVGLPASVDESDLALRPAFVALFSDLLDRVERIRGAGRLTAGGSLIAPDGAEVRGPLGPVVATAATDEDGRPVRLAVAAVRGRYELTRGDVVEARQVTLDPGEIASEPGHVEEAARAVSAAAEARPLDVSREVVLALLALVGAEIVLRALRLRRRDGGRRAADPEREAAR